MYIYTRAGFGHVDAPKFLEPKRLQQSLKLTHCSSNVHFHISQTGMTVAHADNATYLALSTSRNPITDAPKRALEISTTQTPISTAGMEKHVLSVTL